MVTLYGISLQYYIPMRSECSDRSEMVSQVLFGETFTILEKKAKFSFVRLDFDGYEGWVDTRSIHLLNEREYRDYHSIDPVILHTNMTIGSSDSMKPGIKVGAGSTLVISEGVIQPGLKDFLAPEPGEFNKISDKQAALMSYCRHFISVPYLWGGRSDMGIDCSGLVQNLYKQAGIAIPRDASQQVLKGETVNFLSESAPGDIAFFDNEEGIISHVGMLLSTNSILHASGKVRIDSFDHQGIYSEKEREYTHKLRVIKRFFS